MQNESPRRKTLEATFVRFLDWLTQATEERDCTHLTEATASGVDVCVEPTCIFARVDRLLVPDYGTALPRCLLWKAKADLLDEVLPQAVKAK